VSDDWEWELRRVRQEVSSLQDTVQELQQTHDGDDRALRSRLDALKAAVEEAEGEHESVGDRIDAVEQQLAGVARQMQGLERLVRTQAGEEPVALDAAEPHTAGLLEAVRRRNQAQEQLLSPASRSALQQTVASHRRAVRQAAQERAAAVGASAVLADAPLDSREHTSAASTFRTAHHKAAAQASAAARLQDEALRAQARLAEDDAARKAAAAELAAGDQAETQLLLRVRSRIADAVAQARLLPVWFTTVFGLLPDRGEPQRWLEDASACVLYRMLYQVSDPVVLLGEEPGDDGWEQYQALRETVARWSA
jgi:hypothetical protein